MNIIVAILKFPRKKASRVGDINLVGYPDIFAENTGCLSTECLFYFDYGNDTISN